jgi:formylglycine-generating enzyme required for sulfatase activity
MDMDTLYKLFYIIGVLIAVVAGLWKFIAKRAEERPPERRKRKYVEGLRKATAFIDMRRLNQDDDPEPADDVSEIIRVDVERLYVPLKTTSQVLFAREPPRALDNIASPSVQDPRPLAEVVADTENNRLVIIGDPGAGKTTFIRYLAYVLCRIWLGECKPSDYGFCRRPFPLLLKVSELARHIREWRQKTEKVNPTGPEWLTHCMGATARATGVPLGPVFFERLLTSGEAILLIDSIDEGVSEDERKEIAKIIEDAATTEFAGKCRFVVTSRPTAYHGEVVINGFHRVEIAKFDDKDIQAFIAGWCDVMYQGEDEASLKQRRKHLWDDIRSKPAVLDVARTPLTLTVLARLHHKNKVLPEQRAELYDQVLDLLATSRSAPQRTREFLEALALFMQAHPEGRKTELTLWQGAESIAGHFEGPSEKAKVKVAERFLEDATVNTGIVVKHGNIVKFWHECFRELLAASAIAGEKIDEQRNILAAQGQKLFAPEWREVIVLLGGLTHQKKGPQDVDKIISTLLAGCDRDSLAVRCQGAGLIGALLRDAGLGKYRPSDPAAHEFLKQHVPLVFLREPPERVPIELAIEAADALGYLGDPRLARENFAANWVTIPAGEFVMGAQKRDPAQPNFDEDARHDESPPHSVYLDAYQIARYPVTVAEFARFVDGGGYQHQAFWQAGGFAECSARGRPDRWEKQLLFPSRPVVSVSWYEAAAYAVWADRNLLAGCRLPTEAQWERAARGPGGTARKYPWGDATRNRALLNFDGNVGSVTPVGVYPLGAAPIEGKNTHGVDDMAGNVWEWCWDWYAGDYYPNSPPANPCGAKSGPNRVLRGGHWVAESYAPTPASWRGGGGGCRSAARGNCVSHDRAGFFGFRLAAVQ